jgi:hypothetical protein
MFVALFTAILGGVGVLTYHLFLLPTLELRKSITVVSRELKMNAAVIASNPAEIPNEELDKAFRTFRELSAELHRQSQAIPAYGILSMMKIVPSLAGIDEAAKGLTYLARTIRDEGDLVKWEKPSAILNALNLKSD